MAIAWNMALDFMPCKVAVIIDKNTHTKQLVDESGVFALNVPCRHQARATVDVGSISAEDLPNRDKFAKCGMIPFPAILVDVPLVEGCMAGLNAGSSSSRRTRTAMTCTLAKWSRHGLMIACLATAGGA